MVNIGKAPTREVIEPFSQLVVDAREGLEGYRPRWSMLAPIKR